MKSKRMNLDSNSVVFAAGAFMLFTAACLILLTHPHAAGLAPILALSDRVLILAEDSTSGKTQGEDPNADDASRGIPKLLHYAVADDLRVSDGQRSGMKSCLGMNPDWRLRLWTNLATRRLLAKRRWPELLRLYESLASQKERAGLTKYLVTYSVGGVFLEPELRCLTPLKVATEFVSKSAGGGAAFLAMDRPENHMILENSPFKLTLAAMGAPAGHEFFGYALDLLSGRVTLPASINDVGLDETFLTESYQHLRRISNSSSLKSTVPVLLPWQHFSSSLLDPDTMSRLCEQLRQWPGLAKVYAVRQAACNSSFIASNNASIKDAAIGVRDSRLGTHRGPWKRVIFNATVAEWKLT